MSTNLIQFTAGHGFINSPLPDQTVEMTKRCNHYELAFEAYLREHRAAYVAVNEQRRTLVAQGSLKSLDFIVSPSDTVSLLVDVKGRRFPSGARNKQYWRNWSTWDDLESMARWQEKLGSGACALLVFAFHVVGTRSPIEPQRLYEFRDRWYAFLAVRAVDYIQFSRPLSARWQTYSMPARLFRQAAIPFDQILGPLRGEAADSSRPHLATAGEALTDTSLPFPAADQMPRLGRDAAVN